MKIQWYPGHMTKAKRMMQEDIKLIDLVIELLDARIPISSRNPDIDSLAANKSRLILLNKADLADMNITNQWIKYFKDNGINKIIVRGLKLEKDLKKILYKYQKENIKIYFTNGYDEIKEIKLKKPKEKE